MSITNHVKKTKTHKHQWWASSPTPKLSNKQGQMSGHGIFFWLEWQFNLHFVWAAGTERQWADGFLQHEHHRLWNRDILWGNNGLAICLTGRQLFREVNYCFWMTHPGGTKGPQSFHDLWPYTDPFEPCRLCDPDSYSTTVWKDTRLSSLFLTRGLVKLEPSCLEGNMMLIKILKHP